MESVLERLPLSVTTPDGVMGAYIAYPPDLPAPVVIVLHEIMGVNANIRQVADEIADAGFIAIAPDLFWRQEPGVDLDARIPAQWQHALSLYITQNRDLAVADIIATIARGRTLDGTTGKVGVMGFCLGGLLTFLTAARAPVDAAVAYYGGQTEKYLSEARNVRGPLLMHLAGADEYMSPQAQADIRAAFADMPNITFYTYAGRNHAFARHDGMSFDEIDAERANRRTESFFSHHLRQSHT